jgi:hypothetical protein
MEDVLEHDPYMNDFSAVHDELFFECVKAIGNLQIEHQMTLQQLNQMSYDKIVFLWNEYCEEVNYFTDMLYTNDDEAFSTFGFTINGTLINSTNEVYDWDDEFVTADGYGNPLSAADPKILMDLDALLEWYLQKQHDTGSIK